MMYRVAIFALGAAVFMRPWIQAATVPQDQIGKYFFSSPLSTNVTGTVVGEPSAYRVLRREDFAWIREAASERAALAQGAWWGTEQARLEPEFGRWPLAESNRFSRFTAALEWVGGLPVTNIVIGWVSVTNMTPAAVDYANPPDGRIDAFSGLSFGAGTGRYLAATSNDLQAVGTGPWDLPAHTNIESHAVTNWGTYWGDDGPVFNTPTVVEYVSMPMTNGTISVHTNTWEMSLPHVRNVTTTNIEAGTVFDLLFSSGAAPWLNASPPYAMRPFPEYSYVTNSYGLLRQMRMLAESTYNTNLFESVVYRWQYDSADDTWETRPDTWTNTTANVGLYLYGIGPGNVCEGYKSGNGRVLLPSRLHWDVVTTGGVNRISRTDLYAIVNAEIDWFDGEDWTTGQGHCAELVGQATMLPDPQDGMVCFEATVDGPAIAMAGADALGLPNKSSWAEWEDAQGYYLIQFVLVHYISPWASLPGWND